ncbi:Uncharacterized protein SCF082_LOCUS48147 [Durusdinium trenchii]|uniref:Uncharacterized protein n=1 Tax=Durusdinium trenchii TaxID=1381693 RepID=A0ABP0RR00_9DINO
MPPKSKAKRAATAETPAAPEYRNPNVEWHAQLEECLDVLRGHYGDLSAMEPMELTEGALNEPINEKVLLERMSDSTSSVLLSGGVNLLWCSPLATQTPNVKINVSAVISQAKNQWSGGRVSPLLEPVDFIRTDSGAYERVSPEEPIQGLIYHIASRIREGAPEAELAQWKAIVLSSQGRILKLDGFDDKYFHAISRRRRTGDAAKAVTHLASQICADIWLFKKRKESMLNKTMTNAEIAALYLDNMADTVNDEEPRSDEAIRMGHIECGDLSASKLKKNMLDIVLMKKQLKDYLTGRWLDSRQFDSDHKAAARKIFASASSYREKFVDSERTWMSQWPPSASKMMDLFEYCYTFDSSELPQVKAAIKAGKTAQEMIEEYQPYKTMIEEINQALTTESTLLDVTHTEEAAPAQAATEPAPADATQPLTVHDEGVKLHEVDDGWLSLCERTIAKHCCLIVDKGMSQSQLVNAITAPHIRRAPLQSTAVTKVFKAISKVREVDQPGLLPPGDILVIIDGGRKSVGTLLNLFGMHKDRKAFDKGRKEKDGKTLYRQITLTFTEDSVERRKFRKKTKSSYLECSQVAHVYYNGGSTIVHKKNVHFAGTNMGDVLGPIDLPALQNLPKLKVKDKKEFWGTRRRAVGGKTGSDSDSEGSESEGEDEEAEAATTIGDLTTLPGVGAGRGAKGLSDEIVQPVSYHQLPSTVMESFMHSYSAINTIDMTPGTGDAAISAVLMNSGYVGVCHSEAQKEFILVRLKKVLLEAMKDPRSKVYAPAYASQMEQQNEAKRQAETKDPNPAAKSKAKTAPKPIKPPAKDDPNTDPQAKVKSGKPTDAAGKPKAKPKSQPADLSEKLKELLAKSKGAGAGGPDAA